MIRTSPTVGDNSGNGQLRAFVERILRLKEEQDTIAADIREIYAEAKGTGFDKTAMGQLVAHLRKVDKVGAPAVEEGQTIFDLYLDAYQRAAGTKIAIAHAHEAVEIDKLEAAIEKAGGVGAALGAILGVDVEIVRVDSETGEILESVQTETSGPSSLAAHESDESAAPIPQSPVSISSPEQSKPEADSSPASGAILPGPRYSGGSGGDRSIPSSEEDGAKMDGLIAAPDRAAQAVIMQVNSERAATLSDEDVPAFLKKDERNDRCEKQGDCKFAKHPHKITCSDCGTAWAISQRKREVA